MPRSDGPPPLQGSSYALALQMMQLFGGDAALIAWGQADIEADCGHLDLSDKWITVMELILAHASKGLTNRF